MLPEPPEEADMEVALANSIAAELPSPVAAERITVSAVMSAVVSEALSITKPEVEVTLTCAVPAVMESILRLPEP